MNLATKYEKIKLYMYNFLTYHLIQCVLSGHSLFIHVQMIKLYLHHIFKNLLSALIQFIHRHDKD